MKKEKYAVVDEERQRGVIECDLETGKVKIGDIASVRPFYGKGDAEKAKDFANDWAGGFPVFEVKKRIFRRIPESETSNRCGISFSQTEDQELKMEVIIPRPELGKKVSQCFDFYLSYEEVDRLQVMIQNILHRNDSVNK